MEHSGVNVPVGLETVILVLESGVNKHGAEEESSFRFHTLTCRQQQTYTLKPSETRAHAFIRTN